MAKKKRNSGFPYIQATASESAHYTASQINVIDNLIRLYRHCVNQRNQKILLNGATLNTGEYLAYMKECRTILVEIAKVGNFYLSGDDLDNNDTDFNYTINTPNKPLA